MKEERYVAELQYKDLIEIISKKISTNTLAG